MTGSYSHLFPWQAITRTAGLQLAVKLEYPVDVTQLRHDAQTVQERFKAHPQHTIHHDGGWTAILLVAANGDLTEGRAAGNYQPTAALESAPYIREVLNRLSNSTGRVRLLSLAPGEKVCWHYDATDSVDRKFLRIHLPIWTNPGVKFQIGHEDLFWRPGEVWYGEFSYPHRLRNDGTERRVHLVCDVAVDETTRGLVPQYYRDQRPQRERWRPWVQRMVKIHQTAIMRNSRMIQMRTWMGGYDWVRQGGSRSNQPGQQGTSLRSPKQK
jgi:hypothetical protein